MGPVTGRAAYSPRRASPLPVFFFLLLLTWIVPSPALSGQALDDLEKEMSSYPNIEWKERGLVDSLKKCRAGGVIVCVDLGLAYEEIRREESEVDLPECIADRLYELGCKRGAPAGCYLTAWHYYHDRCRIASSSKIEKFKEAGCNRMAEYSLRWNTHRQVSRAYLELFDKICNEELFEDGAAALSTAVSINRASYEQAGEGLNAVEREALDRKLFVKAALGATPAMDTVEVDPVTGEVRMAREPASPNTVKELIEMGANPNARSFDGKSPLVTAIRYGNLKAVRSLLAAGADPNTIEEYGMGALHQAAMQETIDTTLIKILIRYGAGLETKAGGGMTPLMLGAKSGNARAVRVLLNEGADPEAVNENGENALEMAIDAGAAYSSMPLYVKRYEEIEALLKGSSMSGQE